VTDHLTEEQIRLYRKLPAEELFSVDHHLSLCEDCRNRLAESQKSMKQIPELRSYFSTPEPDHLLFEQLKAYVDSTLNETDREIIESHLSLCNQCEQDTADLRQIRSDLLTFRQSNKRSFTNQVLFLWRSPEFSAVFRTVSLAAAAAFVALLAGIILRGPEDEFRAKLEEITDQNQKLEEELRELERKNRTLEDKVPESNTRKLLVSLMDGKSRIEMDEGGNVYGAGAYPEGYRDRIQTVISSGSLTTPPWLRDLGHPGGTVRGEDKESGRFEVLSPVGVVVELDRPKFRWNSVKGASQYQVKIYDNRFRIVTSSPALHSSTWTPSAHLKRGQVYSWQVDALTEGGKITAPLSPAPEAKFKILDEQKLLELERIRREARGSHLVLAVLYTEYGLIAEATKELEELKKANPDSLFAGNLAVK